jgi:hypothetical protein
MLSQRSTMFHSHYQEWQHGGQGIDQVKATPTNNNGTATSVTGAVANDEFSPPRGDLQRQHTVDAISRHRSLGASHRSPATSGHRSPESCRWRQERPRDDYPFWRVGFTRVLGLGKEPRQALFPEFTQPACYRGVANVEALRLFSRAAFPCENWSNCMISLLGWTGERRLVKT